jgi:aspartokinase
MVTVAHLIEKIIEQKPFIQEALSRGIINNAALAEELIPVLEKELRREVKFSAVNMAIRRLAEKIENKQISKVKFDRETDITIKSSLVEITVYKTENSQKNVRKLYGIVKFKEGDFLTITQGLHEVMIITNERYLEKIKSLFARKNIKKIINNLSSLTLNIPMKSTETVGMFHLVTRALNWENISIVDIVSTLTEMTFILKEEDTSKAFEVLKTVIKNNKK